MRIRDWSSDGCSSDLIADRVEIGACAVQPDMEFHAKALQGHAAMVPAKRCLRPDPGQATARLNKGIGAPDSPPRPGRRLPGHPRTIPGRSEEHTSELQSLMRSSYAVFCLKKKTITAPTKRV